MQKNKMLTSSRIDLAIRQYKDEEGYKEEFLPVYKETEKGETPLGGEMRVTAKWKETN
jgi:hypothetical protein